jgi:lipopolysaccharide transport system ATP-binding protein
VREPLVEFDGVWKKFRRGERHDSLRDLIPAAARRLFRRGARPALSAAEFWAVRDISFAVGPGEALGIIGPNGAGKSTILKLLTRILRPTRGRAEVRGRAGALIEVAAGFHPDLTGRENLYLQGAIMGMRRAEITRKFDEIVEFSGVGEFIDTPVKRYSSGMNARLGFAIAAHLDPDVLLIDEVLSVGDVAFQEKCVAHMRAMLARGVPLVFVSHNLSAVTSLCTRAIVLARGQLVFDGQPADAVREYRGVLPALNAAPARDDDGSSPVRITAVAVTAPGSAPATVESGGELRIRIGYHASRPVQAHVAVDIHNAEGVYCAGINTQMDGRTLDPLTGTGAVDLVIPRLWLLPGCYLISAGILDGRRLHPLDVQPRAHPVTVYSPRRDFGLVCLDHAWEHIRHNSVVPEIVAAGAPEVVTS